MYDDVANIRDIKSSAESVYVAYTDQKPHLCRSHQLHSGTYIETCALTDVVLLLFGSQTTVLLCSYVAGPYDNALS